MPLDLLALRDPVAEHDVRGEEHGVRERERDAERLALEPDVGEEVDAADGECERGGVPPRPRAERGERDHRQELDRRDRAERQPVDREVEADVHHRQHGAPGDERRPAALVEPRQRAATAAARAAKTAAAAAIRSQATPRTSTRAKSSTANAGPR